MNLDRRTALAALAAAGLLWGTTVPVTKLALQWLPPGWLTVARFGLAAAVLLAARVPGPRRRQPGRARLGRGRVRRVDPGAERRDHPHQREPCRPAHRGDARAGGGHRGPAAPQRGPSGGLDRLCRVVRRRRAGRRRRGGGASFAGDGLVLASLGFSASFTVAQARLLPGRDPVAVTAVQFLAAALTALPVAAVTEGTPPAAAGAGPVLATAGLVLLGTLAPATLFAYGQARVSAEIAGSFVNLEPLVGVAAGAAVFGDPVGMAQAAGAAAILTGIALAACRSCGPGHARRVRRRCRAGRPPWPRPGLHAEQARMAETWWSTVLVETNRRWAMSALRSPSVTSASTSVSLAVHWPAGAGGGTRPPRQARTPSSPQPAGDRGGKGPGAEPLQLGQGRAQLALLIAVGEGAGGLVRAAERPPALGRGLPVAGHLQHGSATPSASPPAGSRSGPPCRRSQKASSPASHA